MSNALLAIPKRKPKIVVEKALRRKAASERLVLDILLRQGARIPCGCGCGRLLTRDNMQREHMHARELGGDDELDNQVYIAYDPCHKAKTKKDQQAIAKGKRLRGETKQGARKKIRSPGFQTNRDSKLKAKFGGGSSPRNRDQRNDVGAG